MPKRVTPIALGAYLVLSVFFFAGSVALHPQSRFVGSGTDPEIFIWSIAWWPHAIGHAANPFVTRDVWAPFAMNLAWVTSVPALALVLTPITVLGGAVLAYNVAALAMPALAAWTAFLLCRHVTRSLWPSLAGGYLFGFSSYELGHVQGHLHLTSIFLLPVVALLTLRFLEGGLDARGLVVRLGPVLALQLLLSTEVLFTTSVALVVALLLGCALVPRVRARAQQVVAPLVGSYAVAVVLTAPFVAYLVSGFESGSISQPRLYPADLANLVIPTATTWLRLHWTDVRAAQLIGNNSENGAYLGLPLLAIVAWFAWARRRSRPARFLVAAVAVGVLAELGAALHVDGRSVVPLPWDLLLHLPGFDNVLPARLAAFVALAVAVIAALWASAREVPAAVRVGGVAAAIAFTLPNPFYDGWRATPAQPAFFADGLYRTCLRPHETVLALPYGPQSDSMLWQAQSGFAWRLADGYLRPAPPRALPPRWWQTAVELDDQVVRPSAPAVFRRLLRFQHVTTVVQYPWHRELWQPLVRGLGTPESVGGVLVYHLDGSARSCVGSGA